MRTPTARPTGRAAVTNPFTTIRYPWKKNITATVFWIGERPTPRNPTPNHASSWDTQWQLNYGGFDNPDKSARIGYRPKAFTPRLNPFYVALPYNDCINHAVHRPEASEVIPWWNRRPDKRPGKTSCKGRWLQIVHNGKVCYAQWEDCGPFTTDDWQYVFGNKPPKNSKNNGAGIDVSPAVRDYLGLTSHEKVHWRFIDFSRVPRGPWSQYGTNNPFINPKLDPDLKAKQDYMLYLRKMRDRTYQQKNVSR
ncbi:hypothetical protein JIN77_01015 [Verrucomicrobiaceae bacterium R5-34]|uniref:Uncharacterized protein n=1 Tax=Oceaniferula flava TaxID=2800421 RepID=A0AAE2S954_9BACT|nr:hypothetical protein [Verrucomicrobiaceae bacterium R5-34]MBK1853520.1 hypothetical protein [Oceaniferula flavus]MBM1134825.1 hypothetical protein [Oceaniferula flavus]